MTTERAVFVGDPLSGAWVDAAEYNPANPETFGFDHVDPENKTVTRYSRTWWELDGRVFPVFVDTANLARHPVELLFTELIALREKSVAR